MKKLYNKAKNDLWVEQNVCMSVIARYGTGGGNVPIMVETSAVSIGNGQLNQISMSDKSNALDCMHDKQAVIVRSVDTSHADDVVRISNDSVPSLQGRSYKGGNNIQTKYVVRRLTPLECERLQGMPSTKMWDVSKMTHDEYIAWNLAVGHIIVDPEAGKVFRTRGPGGVPYKEPRELRGYVARGYRVINICNGATKMLCRVNRVVWISQNGIIPPGYVVDHINNDKLDNRIQNLQLLTPEENSTKAHDDGLYKCGLDTKATKLDPALHEEIAYLYTYTDITQKKLAEIYGVSKSRISQIIQDIGWSKYGINEKGEVYELSDSARYRLQGNGIATPFWRWMMKRISAQYERTPTLGSLFDGQGSFPMIWEGINGSGTALWSSEIEKHAAAVAKYHFPEEE